MTRLRRLWRCRLGLHAWDHQQKAFYTDGSRIGMSADVVIAWKQCRRCGASRLIHILT